MPYAVKNTACWQTWGWNLFLFSNSHRHLWHSNSMCPDMACDRGLSAGWSVSTSSLLVWHFVIISRCQSWASQHQDGFVRPLVAVHSDGTGRWPNLEWKYHNWWILILTLIAMMNNLTVMDFLFAYLRKLTKSVKAASVLEAHVAKFSSNLCVSLTCNRKGCKEIT